MSLMSKLHSPILTYRVLFTSLIGTTLNNILLLRYMINDYCTYVIFVDMVFDISDITKAYKSIDRCTAYLYTITTMILYMTYPNKKRGLN